MRQCTRCRTLTSTYSAVKAWCKLKKTHGGRALSAQNDFIAEWYSLKSRRPRTRAQGKHLTIFNALPPPDVTSSCKSLAASTQVASEEVRAVLALGGQSR